VLSVVALTTGPWVGRDPGFTAASPGPATVAPTLLFVDTGPLVVVEPLPPLPAGWVRRSILEMVVGVPGDWGINDFGCNQTERPSFVYDGGTVNLCYTPEPPTKRVAIVTFFPAALLELPVTRVDVHRRQRTPAGCGAAVHRRGRNGQPALGDLRLVRRAGVDNGVGQVMVDHAMIERFMTPLHIGYSVSGSLEFGAHPDKPTKPAT